MGWIVWIIVGGLAGWIASIVTKSRNGLFTNILVGLIGSVVGGWLVNGFGFTYDETRFWPALIVSALGAIVLLAILQWISGRRE
jgi:uncharacterized membrane protein YeaQ/YmgE (transglycosylase-associated protein family)